MKSKILTEKGKPISPHSASSPNSPYGSVGSPSTNSNFTIEQNHSTGIISSKKSRIQVYVRVRPPNEQEMQLFQSAQASHCIQVKDSTITVSKEYEAPKAFQFDYVFNEDTTQYNVFSLCAKKTVDDMFEGYQDTLFTYGETGSGKSYTLSEESSDAYSLPNENSQHGIIPRALHYIFQRIKDESDNFESKLSLSYIQIYQEKIQDLLNPNSDNLPLRENGDGVFVQDLSVWNVNSVTEASKLISLGSTNRVTALTKMNAQSSRSHSILILSMERRKKILHDEISERDIKALLKGKLYLVDLCGSERLKRTEATGIRKVEAKFINLSLSALSQTMNALETRKDFVPFRNSKLTRLLQHSLAGGGKTSIIVCISPSSNHAQETISSLMFGSRAMRVQMQAQVYKDVDYKALSLQLQQELDDRDEKLKELEALLEEEIQDYEVMEKKLNNKTLMVKELNNEIEQIVLEHEMEIKKLVQLHDIEIGKVIQEQNLKLSSQNAELFEKVQYIQTLENQLSSSKLQIEILEKKVLELSTMSSEKDVEISILKSKNDQLSETVDNFQEFIDYSNSTISKLENRIKELESVNNCNSFSEMSKKELEHTIDVTYESSNQYRNEFKELPSIAGIVPPFNQIDVTFNQQLQATQEESIRYNEELKNEKIYSNLKEMCNTTVNIDPTCNINDENSILPTDNTSDTFSIHFYGPFNRIFSNNLTKLNYGTHATVNEANKPPSRESHNRSEKIPQATAEVHSSELNSKKFATSGDLIQEIDTKYFQYYRIFIDQLSTISNTEKFSTLFEEVRRCLQCEVLYTGKTIVGTYTFYRNKLEEFLKRKFDKIQSELSSEIEEIEVDFIKKLQNLGNLFHKFDKQEVFENEKLIANQRILIHILEEKLSSCMTVISFLESRIKELLTLNDSLSQTNVTFEIGISRMHQFSIHLSTFINDLEKEFNSIGYLPFLPSTNISIDHINEETFKKISSVIYDYTLVQINESQLDSNFDIPNNSKTIEHLKNCDSEFFDVHLSHMDESLHPSNCQREIDQWLTKIRNYYQHGTPSIYKNEFLMKNYEQGLQEASQNFLTEVLSLFTKFEPNYQTFTYSSSQEVTKEKEKLCSNIKSGEENDRNSTLEFLASPNLHEPQIHDLDLSLIPSPPSTPSQTSRSFPISNDIIDIEKLQSFLYGRILATYFAFLQYENLKKYQFNHYTSQYKIYKHIIYELLNVLQKLTQEKLMLQQKIQNCEETISLKDEEIRKIEENYKKEKAALIIQSYFKRMKVAQMLQEENKENEIIRQENILKKKYIEALTRSRNILKEKRDKYRMTLHEQTSKTGSLLIRQSYSEINQFFGECTSSFLL